METTQPQVYEEGYPKHKYSQTGADVRVESSEEESALTGGPWYDMPSEFGIITCPSADQMQAPNVPRPMSYAPNAWGPPLAGATSQSSGGGQYNP